MAHPLHRRDWNAPELDAFVQSLDDRMSDVLQQVTASELWTTVTSPATDPALLRILMREVYFEIYSYQPQVIEATIATIGRMPKGDPKMIQQMLIHQSEEADHGEMALRDYVALGGNEAWARASRPSPAAFAVASVWWGLWRMADPFAYLGALYPFEGLTPIVCGRVREALLARGFPASALEFIDFHATEDIKHTNLVRKLLKYVVKTYPGAETTIRQGLENFLAVYPMPVWQTAFDRARVEHARASAA